MSSLVFETRLKIIQVVTLLGKVSLLTKHMTKRPLHILVVRPAKIARL